MKRERGRDARVALRLALIRVAEQLDLHRLVSERVLAQQRDGLVKTVSIYDRIFSIVKYYLE